MKKLIATVFAVFCASPLLTASGQAKNTKTIHVLVWDERQPKQAVAYKDFLGNEIAKRITDQTSDFEVRSGALNHADHGLDAGNGDPCIV